MRRTFGLEIGTGLFVLLGIGALFFLAIETTNMNSLNTGSTYAVHAEFSDVGGLKQGAAVSLAGVRIGRVTSITLDPKSLEAEVTMRIEDRFNQIPTDSSASIQTKGLLGDQYIGISPGGSLKSLKNGDTIHFTQSAIVLENLISQFMFNKSSSSGGKSNGSNQ